MNNIDPNPTSPTTFKVEISEPPVGFVSKPGLGAWMSKHKLALIVLHKEIAPRMDYTLFCYQMYHQVATVQER